MSQQEPGFCAAAGARVLYLSRYQGSVPQQEPGFCVSGGARVLCCSRSQGFVPQQVPGFCVTGGSRVLCCSRYQGSVPQEVAGFCITELPLQSGTQRATGTWVCCSEFLRTSRWQERPGKQAQDPPKLPPSVRPPSWALIASLVGKPRACLVLGSMREWELVQRPHWNLLNSNSPLGVATTPRPASSILPWPKCSQKE